MISTVNAKFIVFSIAFLIPFFINIKLTRLLLNFTTRFNLSFYKEKRRVQELNKSRLGGLGILLSLTIGLFIVIQIANLLVIDFNTTIPLVIIITALCFSLIGIVDDIFGLSPFYRLILQFIISTLAWSNGLKIESLSFLYIFFDPVSVNLSDSISLLLTILWISGLTNAINWLDGQDGLAASFSSIAFFILTILFFDNNLYNLALLTLAAIGSCFGFLKYNFYPSKIFMGDGGSYLLGCLLACSTIFLKLNDIKGFSQPILNSENSMLVIIPLLIFLIPILDMISVISQRLIYKKSPFLPDKRHFHHKLKNNGLNERDLVYFTSSFSLLLGVIAICCTGTENIRNTISLIITFSIFLSLCIIYASKVKRFRLKNRS